MGKNQQQDFSKEKTDNNKGKNKNECKMMGIIIQIVLFIFNGAVWVISLLSIIGGFIIGLNTKTIAIRLDFLDFIVTTPATIFITYGLFIVLAAVLGCFTATGGNKLITASYILMLLAVLVFDGLLGIRAFYSTNLKDYIKNIGESMNDYGKEKPGKSVGIFRLHPTVYWDHLQSKGQCCGMNFFHDWKNTTLGKKKQSVPDTCCNAQYEYKFCGSHIFRHPDTDHHEALDIIHTRGCLSIFPTVLVSSFEESVYIGLALGSVLIFCLLLAITLFILVVTKKHVPGGGPELNWNSELLKKRQTILDKTKNDGNNRNARRVTPIIPHSGPGGGDQLRQTSFYEKERRVSFKQTTSFIPNENSQPLHKTHEASIHYYPQERRRNSD